MLNSGNNDQEQNWLLSKGKESPVRLVRDCNPWVSKMKIGRKVTVGNFSDFGLNN
jgi:anti-sigma factor ChrR (cupin superfamily)